MMMDHLPDLDFECTVPYSRMQGRIGWTAHKVRSHINSFCCKHSDRCSTDAVYDTRPFNCYPHEDAALCMNCKNTVWGFGTEVEARRQAIRAGRVRLVALIIAHIPKEVRDIIIKYQFPKQVSSYELMSRGWCSTPACIWRVKK